MAAADRPAPPSSISPGAAAVVVAGVAALLARPLAGRAVPDPTWALIGLFVLLGAAGAWWPLPRPGPGVRGPVGPAAAAALGVAAFALGRALAGPAFSLPAAAAPVALNALAAVAEEAFFRRLLFGLLAPHGRVAAVLGSAMAFAAVHVTVWGPGVLPLDLAAGLVLSWQRSASGTWTASAVTHVAANLLAAL